MATTSDLVDALVGDLTPAPRAWVARRLALGFAGGAALAAMAVFWLWGLRPDLATAVATGSFWVKLGYPGCLALAGLAAVNRLARPDGRERQALGVAAAIVTAMIVLALIQLLRAPEAARAGLVMGSTAASCPWLVMTLSIPIFAGGTWAVRAMAPTCLNCAGAALGWASGALAAFVYSLSCDEPAMPFVLVWYSLGIIAPIVFGFATGRRLLRW